ncbi:MAG: glycosyltransferase family 2 protein [Cyanobacteriota bacterium]|jgi:glycosyltransferase involved in cell wall biosynthesis
MSPTIAGVVLTLNEEQDLARALASLRWCDERLVLDSGSVDGTVALARGLGVRVAEHHQPPPFRISEQRNWALEGTGLHSDWVLFLDADEEVGPELAAEIRRQVADPAAPDGFELTPRYWFFGRWLKRTQGYPNWHPRLVRRGALRFEGGVWECFPAGARLGRIPLPYEHYAFSKGLDDWLERHRRYASWDAETIVAYHQRGEMAALGTRRFLPQRALAARLWPLRPPLRFLQKYVVQGGWLEGWQALLFASLMACYDLMTVVKVIELRRRRRGLPL